MNHIFLFSLALILSVVFLYCGIFYIRAYRKLGSNASLISVLKSACTISFILCSYAALIFFGFIRG